MPDRPKRVAAIHDLSGFGRCSLTVILPTLSVMGVQVCPIPTAVFSTHTGGLGEVQRRDLSDFTLPCLEHEPLPAPFHPDRCGPVVIQGLPYNSQVFFHHKYCSFLCYYSEDRSKKGYSNQKHVL